MFNWLKPGSKNNKPNNDQKWEKSNDAVIPDETERPFTSDSVRALLKTAIADAEQIAASIKVRAQSEAEVEAAKVLNQARVEAEELKEKAEKEARQKAETVLAAANKEAELTTMEAKQRALQFLVEASGEIDKEIQGEYKRVYTDLSSSLQMLLNQGQDLQKELKGKTARLLEGRNLEIKGRDNTLLGTGEAATPPAEVKATAETGRKTEFTGAKIAAEPVSDHVPVKAEKHKKVEARNASKILENQSKEGEKAREALEKQAKEEARSQAAEAEKTRKQAKEDAKRQEEEAKKAKEAKEALQASLKEETKRKAEEEKKEKEARLKEEASRKAEEAKRAGEAKKQGKKSSFFSLKVGGLSLRKEKPAQVKPGLPKEKEKIVQDKAAPLAVVEKPVPAEVTSPGKAGISVRNVEAPENTADKPPESEGKGMPLEATKEPVEEHQERLQPAAGITRDEHESVVLKLDRQIAYTGEVELIVASPVELSLVSKLYNYLQTVPDLKILSTKGSWDKGTSIMIVLEKPVQLINVLLETPEVQVTPELVEKINPGTSKPLPVVKAGEKRLGAVRLTLNDAQTS